MIVDRTIFQYENKILIEKVRIRLPFHYEAIFEDSGCFIYFKEEGGRLYSPKSELQIGGREAVLLKCGTHFLNLLGERENEEVEVIVIHLYPEMLKKLYFSELPAIIEKQGQGHQSQFIAGSDLISKFIESLEFYFQYPALVNNDLLELKIKELILLLIQSKNVQSILDLVADLYSSKTAQLKEVVEVHLYSNLKVEELAKLSHLSLSSFKREFKKEFNDSPANYILSKKLEKARELLRLTDLSISEIAYEVGFQDPLYFTRIFKKRVAVTPSQYRSGSQ